MKYFSGIHVRINPKSMSIQKSFVEILKKFQKKSPNELISKFSLIRFYKTFISFQSRFMLNSFQFSLYHKDKRNNYQECF